MENDSKSGLKISEILATLSTLIILSTSTLILVSNKNTKEEIIIEQIGQESIEQQNSVKTISTTSRSGIRRGESLKGTEQYIKAEEIEISKEMDLSKNTGISKQEFKELMKNLDKDTSGFFKNYSDLIYDLCIEYEINEVFFCGLIAGESGWNIATSHREKCNYISMMYKGKLIKYDTPEKGLEAAAKLLHKSYLSEDGAFYSGKTLKDVQKIFCPKSSDWVDLVYSCMEQIVG